ncbi:MAG: YlmH/Sll1252 family protein [Tissierellia bacterium]|nr:YlmH/Sll1252 family protein [Tissierellia bacterium]
MTLEYNIDFIRDKNKKTNIKKAISLLEKAFYTKKFVYSFFLDPMEQKIISNIAKNNDIDIKFVGGNEKAERKIFLVNFNHCLNEDYIRVLIIKDINLEHKDILGALISLGIDRENIGDIVIDKNCEFVVLEDDYPFIKYNLTKIANKSVKVEEKKINTLMDKRLEYKINKIFVSSLRIDNLVSSILNLSRKKAKDLIKKKKIKIDYMIVDDPSYQVEEESLISIRGYGRYIFDQIIGSSKKGNYHIIYKKVL